MKEIDRRYRIVAGAPNANDVIELVSAVADEVADIRTKTSGQMGAMSIESRQAAITILTHVIDRLRGIRKNELQRSSGLIDEDS